MKTNKLFIFILFGYIVLAISIISTFTIFCEANEGLSKAIIISSILSLIMFFILFIFEKKIIVSNFLVQNSLQKEIHKKNYIDELTNLSNRAKFFEDLKSAKGIILFDLDDFSILNSVYSKEFGDEFLKKLSAKLRHSNCANKLYRMGGDEFSVIVQEEKDLKEIAQCLKKEIDNFYIIKDNVMIQLSATFAISYTKPFIETADLALKYGKKNHLNLVIYSQRLGVFEDSQMFFDITLRIKKALKTNNVVPFFQCIKDKNENIVRYEALMRLKEGDKHLLPGMFLDVAKKTKLYPDLTIQMIKKTFEYMKDKDIPFSINLSYDDIINHRVYDFLFENIKKFPKKENIIIELLETEAIAQFSYVKDFIDRLHKLNSKVAIDDFGSGYSNFIYLEKLNIDIIKIDGEIVKNIISSENSVFLIHTIVEFCKKNNIISIAEYVSHREIFFALKDIGVDEYQGFYFCKPQESIKE